MALQQEHAAIPTTTTTTEAPVPFTVQGKSAIITGAGSGINYCFASLLLSKGCNVLIADLALRPEAQKLVDEYSSTTAAGPDDNGTTKGRARAVFVETDVTIWTQLENLFSVAMREFGSVDLVCPGAGVFEPHWSNFWHPPGTSRSKDLGNSNHYALLDINLTHPIRLTQLAISHFLHPPPPSSSNHKNSNNRPVSLANPKRIIHISSIAAQLASLPTPIYAASKAAISSLIRSLAPLSTLGIRVNGVAPGVIKTPLWTEHPEKLDTMIDERTDVWVMPEEVALAMLELVESTHEREEERGAGVVLEVGKGRWRVVGRLGDEGPGGGEGTTAAKMEVAVKEVWDWLGVEGWGKGKGV